MLTIFLSQPMSGYTEDEILGRREKIFNHIKQNIKTYSEVIPNEVLRDCGTYDLFLLNTYTKVYTEMFYKHLELELCCTAINKMPVADVVFFTPDWEGARGCRIEHLLATEYGLPVIILPKSVDD